MAAAPQPPVAPEESGKKVLSSATKVGAAIAAFTGGVVGLVTFSNLGFFVVAPSLYAAALLCLGYFALTTKRRWVKITDWIIFSLLVIVGAVIYVAFRYITS